MSITNLKISMNEYKRLVEEDIKKAGDSTVYGNLLSNLSALTSLTEKYFTCDTNGNLPILNAEDYKKLTDSYTKLAESCNKFLAEDHPKNKLENKRIHMIKQLSGYVGKDLQGLIKADKTKGSTLSDVVKDARIKTVDLTNEKLGCVGGNISSRIPLMTSSGTKGFFTKKSVFNFKEEQIRVFANYSNLLPEPYGEILKEYVEDTELAENLLDKMSFMEKINLDDTVTEKKYDEVADIFMDLADEEKSVIKEKLMENPEFFKKSVEMFNELKGIVTKNDAYEITGIPDGARSDQRNSAMTDIAAYMGMNHILAKAVPMQIIHNNEVIEGTFMENANGEDITRLTPESKMMQADKESFNNPSLLKKVADIQILDYICGNTDRHSGNMLYTLEKDENGKMMVSGIVGIDNDNSFGTLLFDKDGASAQLTTLDKIGVISQSCFHTVRNMSPDALKVILGDKLSVEEMNAAAKRLTLLQKELTNERIKLVEDHQWGKGEFTLDKLEKAGSAFRNVNRIAKQVEHEKELIQSEPVRNTAIDFASGKDVTDTAKQQFEEVYSKLYDFAKMINQFKSRIHRNSNEYKNMLLALKDVTLYGKELKEKLERNETIAENEYKEFTQRTVNLGIASQKYIDAKNLSQHTQLGRDRFAFATEMRNFVQENIANKEIQVKENAEIKEQAPQMQL